MTAETDLPPLPPEDDDLPRSGMWNGSARTGSDPCWLRESVEAYARACVSSATEAARANLAELQREVEGLRAEVGETKEVAVRAMRQRDAQYNRAERLAEALREAREYVVSELAGERAKFAGYEHCSTIASIEADIAKIDAALDQETTNG